MTNSSLHVHRVLRMSNGSTTEEVWKTRGTTMNKLYSSAVATVLGAAAVGGIALGAVAIGPVAQKGDRLPVMEKVVCSVDCVEQDRFDAAFDTFSSEDIDGGVTTLTRVRN